MKLVLFAHRTVGFECVKYLHENSIDQLVVISNDDTGEDTSFKSVKKLVIDKHISFIQTRSINDNVLFEKLKFFNANASFSCYFPMIIPKKILSLFKNGSLNLHGALLPEYMGTFSGAWSLLNDEKKSGSTLHYMNEKVDTGDIVDRIEVLINKNDTALSLYNKISLKSIDLFKKYCMDLAKGMTIPRYSQNFDNAHYYKRNVPYDGIINWNWNGRRVYNFWRALNFPPFKNAVTFFEKNEIEIIKCKEIHSQKKETYGKILSINKYGILVSCKGSDILLEKIKINDKNIYYTELIKLSIEVGRILGK